MTFEEILPHIRKHEKVYRKGWSAADGGENDTYIILSDRGARYLYLYVYNGAKLFDDAYTLSGFDITADDWEIFK